MPAVVREFGMQKDTTKHQKWIKPQLSRLGEIKDVGGPGQTLKNRIPRPKPEENSAILGMRPSSRPLSAPFIFEL